MQNTTTSNSTNPLGIKISGTGEYVKEQVANLVSYFDFIKQDAEEEIRQSYEN